MPIWHGDGPGIWRPEDRSRRRQSCSSLPRSGLCARRQVSPAPHFAQARANLLVWLPSLLALTSRFALLCAFVCLLGLEHHNSLRSTLLCGIRERRSSHQIDGVGTLIIGDKSFTDRGVHGAVSGAGLVRKAPKVFLEESFLEVFARVPGHDFVAQLRRKLIKAFSEGIETNARIEQSYFRAHVVSDAGGGVQGNSLPGSLYLLFGDVMCGEELTDGVCGIYLAAFG